MGLLAYGLASQPPSPGRVQIVPGVTPEEQVVLMTTGEPTEPPFLELVRLDEQKRPVTLSYLQHSAGAAARIGERLFLFAPEGATSVIEELELTQGSTSFQIDRFSGAELMDQVLDAASDQNEALVVGRGVEGRPDYRLFDGISFAALEGGSGEGPERVDDLVVACLGRRQYLLAARSGERLFTAQVEAGRLEWRGSVLLGPGGPGLALFAGDGDAPAVFALGGTDAVESGLLRIPLGPSGGPGDPQILAALDRVESTRLLGPARLQPRAVLLAADGELQSVGESSVDQEPDAWPMFLVAWRANWTRFERPLGLQLALFVLLGLFSRRMRSARVDSDPRAQGRVGPPADPEPTDPPVPAGLPRRAVAFLVDLAVLLVLSLILFALALHPVEFEYMTFAYVDAAIRAERAGESLLLVSGALEALMIDARLLFMLLMTGVLTLTEVAFGRSPGKALLGLRVVRLDGGVPGVGAAATRALMLLVDWFWSFGAVGLLLAAFTRRRQRLGDLMAGTMVIRKEVMNHTGSVSSPESACGE